MSAPRPINVQKDKARKKSKAEELAWRMSNVSESRNVAVEKLPEEAEEEIKTRNTERKITQMTPKSFLVDPHDRLTGRTKEEQNRGDEIQAIEDLEGPSDDKPMPKGNSAQNEQMDHEVVIGVDERLH